MEIEGRGRGGGRRGGRQGWRKGGNNGHPLKNHLNPAWNGFDRFVNPTAVHGMYSTYFLKISNLYPMLDFINYQRSRKQLNSGWANSNGLSICVSVLFSIPAKSRWAIAHPAHPIPVLLYNVIEILLGKGLWILCLYHIIHESYFIILSSFALKCNTFRFISGEPVKVEVNMFLREVGPLNLDDSVSCTMP